MRHRSILLAFVPTLLLSAAAAQLPHVNWENHPVHPVDLSPAGTLLAVTHTADGRLQLFDVSTGRPSPVGHVPVGVDPVAVRFRTDREAWVVNHLSDSVSVVDVERRTVLATLKTKDEPFDVVFADGGAWVSSSSTNTIQRFDPADLDAPPVDVPVAGEDPRALAVSPDGRTVYAAIFESGNGTTVLRGARLQDVVNDRSGPHGGTNPPPNVGDGLVPPLAPGLPPPQRQALIVRRDGAGRWRDDSGTDWTPFVSGERAPESGRIVGWDLADRDIAAIDTASRTVRYATGLMNIGMALAVNPASGELTLVGTEAHNEIRFEPNVNGIFATVTVAQVDPATLAGQVTDLNPHLDYTVRSVPKAERERSVGDPRAVLWRADGQRGYVAGMGSNNVVTIDSAGRVSDAPPIEVGEGPAGLALSADERFLYVWNHFEASLSTVDLPAGREIARLAAFDPLPAAIREGRRFLYDTHETSGLGHVACATCHVDARTDRLAWDLGDPSGEVAPFAGNCLSEALLRCADHHPIKGPMLTQTLQDIIGKEPFHWRGDFPGLETFNANYPKLQAADPISAAEMQRFEDFLATIVIPPNPFRELDNSLSRNLDLSWLATSDRFGPAGRPLPPGDAVAGMEQYRTEPLVPIPLGNAVTDCATCHSLPTGMGVNGPVRDARQDLLLGGRIIPPGPAGENHLQITTMSTEQNRTMKVPSLRTLYDRIGFEKHSQESRAGFGFLHDGTVDTLAAFISLEEFAVVSEQQVADLVAFMLSFSGSELPVEHPAYTVTPPLSNDTHAAVGQQETFPGGSRSRLSTFAALADAGKVDLVAHRAGGVLPRGYAYADGAFSPDDATAALSLQALRASARGVDPVTFTVVPAGLGERLGIDRDGDGIANGLEFEQGSDPADAASTAFAPAQGLWFNPERSGHGIDLQRAGDLLAATWYTYEDDGTPVWYQAVDAFTGRNWSAALLRYTWDPAAGEVVGETVGEMAFAFGTARRAELCWTVRGDSGCEPFQRFAFTEGFPAVDYTGLWFDPAEPGYGLSVDSQGDTRVVVVYYYDAENQPRWVIGQGDNAPANAITMLSFEGFCPACGAVATESVAAGTVGLAFNGQRAAALELAIAYPGDGTPFERSEVDLAPLTDVPVNYGR